MRRRIIGSILRVDREYIYRNVLESLTILTLKPTARMPVTPIPSRVDGRDRN